MKSGYNLARREPSLAAALAHVQRKKRGKYPYWVREYLYDFYWRYMQDFAHYHLGGSLHKRLFDVVEPRVRAVDGKLDLGFIEVLIFDAEMIDRHKEVFESYTKRRLVYPWSRCSFAAELVRIDTSGAAVDLISSTALEAAKDWYVRELQIFLGIEDDRVFLNEKGIWLILGEVDLDQLGIEYQHECEEDEDGYNLQNS